MHKQIGILGGNGVLGHMLTKQLCEIEYVQIKVATRTDDFLKIHRDNVKYEKLCLDCLEELKKFIKACDVIINCTGHFSKKLLEHCLDYNVHYLDTSGELNLTQNDQQVNFDLKQKRSSTIQFVGVNPGLTEALIAYCKQVYTISELEMFFSGIGELSKSAI